MPVRLRPAHAIARHMGWRRTAGNVGARTLRAEELDMGTLGGRLVPPT